MRHVWHFSLSIPKLLGSSFFCFILQDEKVVRLTQNLINIFALTFRWIEEIDLCKSAFKLIEVSEDVIAIAKEYKYTRKSHVEEPYLPLVAHEVVAAPP